MAFHKTLLLPSGERKPLMVTEFLYSLAGGMMLVLATGRLTQIARPFLRLIGLLVFGITCGVFTWHALQGGEQRTTAQLWTAVLGAGCGVASVAMVLMTPFAAQLPGKLRLVCIAGGLLGVAAGTVATLAGLEPQNGALLAPILIAINNVLGAVLLGSITVAWLLGHAYLTATKMTIAPLRHFSGVLSWTVAGRLAFLIISLTIAGFTGDGTSSSVFGQLGGAWLMLLLRIGLGIVGLAIFSFMVLDCVRLRSTQSATGILYFASIFAYIGELASKQLVVECGWPL